MTKEKERFRRHILAFTCKVKVRKSLHRRDSVCFLWLCSHKLTKQDIKKKIMSLAKSDFSLYLHL